MSVRTVVAGLAVFTCTACSAGPNYRPLSGAALSVPGHYSIGTSSSVASTAADWWRQFRDPELTRLVESGTADNLDIGIAVARLRQARAASIEARAGQLPTVSASGQAARSGVVSGPGTMANSLSLGIDASWQVDLFGGVARGVEAARADLGASRYDYAAVVVSVQSEIARDYLQLRLQQAQRTVTRQSLINQDENLQIASWKRQAGLVSQLDVEQARTQRAQTAAALAQLESACDQSAALIAVLLGREPGALRTELALPAAIPDAAPDIAIGLPAALLRQRADVRAAERTLAAATARIGVAQAQLWPALSLSGNLATAAPTAAGLFDVITGGAFATLAHTIFDAGRRRAQVRGQEAAAEAALASYRKAVLDALADVENAVSSVNAADRRASEYGDAAAAANSAAVLAREQYRSGLIDFATLLSSENQLLAARNSLAQAQSDRAAARVQLFVSLGGGWEETATVPGETAAYRSRP